ncbi:MAG TPA: zinc-binding dehydrogenase [bacterium]|nr:zinc-binding dehydrogenase [bacterium]
MQGKMKALIFPENWKVDYIEVDIPKPGPGEVLAEVVSCGICGSDVGIYEGDHWIIAHGPGGHGHESGCVAVEVGSGVEGIKPGDHLARMGACYAQYTKEVNVVGHGKAEDTGALPIVRNDLTCEEISFADAVGCALNCAERAELERIEGRQPSAVILGLGPIGLLLAQILINRGVRVAASEPFGHKRMLAEKWGATVFDPGRYKRSEYGRKKYTEFIKEEFGEADAVFEMVGHNDTLLDAIHLVRPGLRVLVFGAQKEQHIPYEDCRRKGIEIVYPEAMVNSKAGVEYWDAALDLIAGVDGKKLDLESLVTKRISLEQAAYDFEHYNREEWIKVIVEPARDN